MTGRLEALRDGGGLPTFVGSGVSPENAAESLSVADGAIVGVSFKPGGPMGETTDPGRVRRLMDVVSGLR